jgi:primosomal protein DnaI
MTSLEENQNYLNQLIKENQIPETTLQTYQLEIDQFLKGHFQCNPKTSFKKCQQEHPGYEIILTYENGQFYQKMIPCAHLAKQQEIDKTLKLFYYVNFNPLTPTDFLFVKKLSMQKDFYTLDKDQDYLEIKKFISDKNEFEQKSQLVENFLAKMDSKNPQQKGVYLVGPMGVGKTNLLKFLTLIAATKYQKTVAFTTVTELTNKLKQGFDDNSINVNKFLDELKIVDLLVLDDLGSEQVTK